MYNKTLSWKIDNGCYAYIVKVPETNSHIINKRLEVGDELLTRIIKEASSLDTFEKYEQSFLSMVDELERKGITVTKTAEDFYKGGNGEETQNVFLISGKDGENGIGGSGGGGFGDGGYFDEDDNGVYDNFLKDLEDKFNAAKEDLLEQNKDIQEKILSEVQGEITDAKRVIEETKEELDRTKEELSGQLKDAKDALEEASKMFEMGDEGIDSGKIIEVFSSVEEFEAWMKKYSGSVETLKTDYDATTEQMGIIGESESVKDGLFSHFATSLTSMSGTIGNVERTMNASVGSIQDMVSWYDTYASSVTEASRFISASAGQITDTLSYIDGEFTTKMISEMDARDGAMRNEIMMETSGGLSNIRQELNALSASMVSEITNVNSSGDVTALGERMSALEGSMQRYITKTDSAMSLTIDLREEWTLENGKLSTVASLIAERDADGNIIYYASGSTGPEEVVTQNSDGEWYGNSSGIKYDSSDVYVHFSDTMASYIQQEASAVTLAVMSDDSGLTAAIKIAIENDKSVIEMIADEVVISADMIVNAISASSANIGGVVLDYGSIYCDKKDSNGEPLFLLDGTNGELTARNAKIYGSVYADSGYFKGSVSADTGYFKGAITATSLTLGTQDIDEYIDGRIPSGTPTMSDIEGIIEDYLESEDFESLIGGKGYITQDDLNKYLAQQSGITAEEASALCKTLIGAEINVPEEPKSDGSGGTIHTIHIGDETYSWTTVDGGGYVVLNNKYGNGESGSGSSFLVSKEGLMVANNAIVYGKIYASEGYFQGDVTAKTLTIGTQNIDEYIDGRVPSGTPTMTDVEKLVSDALDNMDIEGIVGSKGYITQEDLEGYLAQQSGITAEEASALCQTLIGAEINVPEEPKSDGSGGTIHTIHIGGETYKWTTVDGGGYVVLDSKYGNGVSGNGSSFLVSKEGLMVANNAIVYGKIYASEGYFQGDVTANTLTIGTQNIDEYIDGRIPSGTPTMTDVEELVSEALDEMDIEGIINNKGYITQTDLDEYFAQQSGITAEEASALCKTLIGAEINFTEEPKSDGSGGTIHTVSIGDKTYSWTTLDGDKYFLLGQQYGSGTSANGLSSVVISKDGLLQANNAVVYGSIYASEGKFQGEIAANSGTIGGFKISNNMLYSIDETAILKGSATTSADEDLFKLGLNTSEKIVMYAYKASGSTLNTGEWSAITTYDYIYSPQQTFEDGEAIKVYYMASGIVLYPATVGLNEFSASNVTTILIPGRSWWEGTFGKQNIYKIQVSVTYKNGTFTATRNEYYYRTEAFSNENDLTAETCAASGLSFYNTRITSNGVLHCDTINANEGYFGGTINSDGNFTGTLNCNKGTLNNVGLKNSEFYGTTVFNSGSSLSSIYGSTRQRYFHVTPYSVEDSSVKTYDNASYYRYIKNSNGNNNGQRYYSGAYSGESINLVDITVSSGSTIKIPQITISMWRYIPTNRTGGSGTITVKYTLGNRSGTLKTVSVTSQSHGSTTYSGVTSTTTLTANTDTRFTISLLYNVHLPTYYWLGADKAATSISVTNSNSITVTPAAAITEGFVVGTDGFMVKKGNYGIKVTDEGIQVSTNGTWRTYTF